MPPLELTEALAWALIAAGVGYAALLARGVSAAAVTAALAALAMKTMILDSG